MTGDGIAMVVSGFPRRSETFVLGELVALEASGILAGIFATKPGDTAEPHPDVARLAGRVEVLPAGTPLEQSEALVARLRGVRLAGVHGYFAHTPADVAACAADRLGVSYGFTAHARDARKVPAAHLAHLARGAAGVLACNTDVAAELSAAGVAARLVPHGVDLERFKPQQPPPRVRPRLQLLAVGRLVPKKGFDVLLAAAARLEIPFELRIIGDGSERPRLASQIAALDLADRVTLYAGRTHAELPDDYAAADILVVPSVVDATGDRDGLPNVVLEALASGRPVVASSVGSIAAVLAHRHTGWLVPPGDAHALADALQTLGADPALREQIGARGRARVERGFAARACAERLERALMAMYA
jgi:glycosyltransferase involved in cell wall biosynthesis